MNNDKIQPSKLDIILEKKQNLDTTIQECEIRIDAKLASLIDEGFISKEMNPELFETTIQDSYQPSEHFLSGVDITDDDALDQAVLNSRPFDSRTNRLAFDGDLLTNQPSHLNDMVGSNTPIGDDEDDDELPTLSKILGRTTPYAYESEGKSAISNPIPEARANLPDDANALLNSSVSGPDGNSANAESAFAAEPLTVLTVPEKTAQHQSEKPTVVSDRQTNEQQMPDGKEKPKKSKEKVARQKKTNPKKKENKPLIKKPSFTDMVPPLVFFFIGLMAFGAFLIFTASEFNFIDYCVVFILFTCLIFTIATPYGASIFFMILLLCSYVILSLISVFYLEVPFEFYQIGWLFVIPMILWSSALLIKNVRELFHFKKSLEQQIASYDNLEESPGLTIEKAYYKDLKYAMDRASRGETILTLEMITVCHLDDLKSMDGSRLWDEILYKTLKIIKHHCYSTHLIYILDGSVFSILMENTSVKNQLLINQEITDAFNALILEYETIEADVKLSIASIPYTRDITNPFDYRALVLRHLKK